MTLMHLYTALLHVKSFILHLFLPPFFPPPLSSLIYKDMERLIDEAKVSRGQQENLLEDAGAEGETPPPSSNFQGDLEAGIKSVAEHVIHRIEQDLEVKYMYTKSTVMMLILALEIHLYK